MKNIFKKETPADKIVNEINSMEFKKQSMVSVIKNEISTIEFDKRNEIFNIGLYIYENHKEKMEELGIKEKVEKIQSLNQQIEAQQDKINEVSSRYDEEIGLMHTNLKMFQASAMNMGQPYGNNNMPQQNNMPQMNGMPQQNGMPQMNGMPQQNGMPQMNGMPQQNNMPQMNGMPQQNNMPTMNGMPQQNNMPPMNAIPQQSDVNQSTNNCFCGNCGVGLGESDEFCHNCGTPNK